MMSKTRQWNGIIATFALTAAGTFSLSYLFGPIFRNPFALLTIPILFIVYTSLETIVIVFTFKLPATSGRDIVRALAAGIGLSILSILSAYLLSVKLFHQNPINPKMYFESSMNSSSE